MQYALDVWLCISFLLKCQLLFKPYTFHGFFNAVVFPCFHCQLALDHSADPHCAVCGQYTLFWFFSAVVCFLRFTRVLVLPRCRFFLIIYSTESQIKEIYAFLNVASKQKFRQKVVIQTVNRQQLYFDMQIDLIHIYCFNANILHIDESFNYVSTSVKFLIKNNICKLWSKEVIR